MNSSSSSSKMIKDMKISSRKEVAKYGISTIQDRRSILLVLQRIKRNCNLFFFRQGFCCVPLSVLLNINDSSHSSSVSCWSHVCLSASLSIPKVLSGSGAETYGGISGYGWPVPRHCPPDHRTVHSESGWKRYYILLSFKEHAGLLLLYFICLLYLEPYHTISIKEVIGRPPLKCSSKCNDLNMTTKGDKLQDKFDKFV